MAPPGVAAHAAVGLLTAGRLVAVGPTGVGAVLALWGIGMESLWLDEASSLSLAQMPFGAFWRQATGAEINATAYFLLLRGWVTFGTDETWIRLLSALFAIATLPIVHVLARRLFGEPRAAIATLVLATSPFFIEFAQEARGYSLALLLASSTSLAFILALERSTLWRWVAWAVLAGVGLYAHLFTVFVVAAQLLVGVGAALVEPSLRPRLRPLFTSAAAVGLFAIPIVAEATAPGREHLAQIPPPTPLVVVRTGFLVTGGFEPLTILVGLLAATGAVATALAWRRGDVSGRARLGLLLAWAWLLIPPLASLAISLVKPIFSSRYLIVMLPGIALVVALGVTSFRPRRLAGAALAVLVATSLAGCFLQAATPSKEDWRGAAATVLDRAEPGDAIAFVSASVAKPFAYYVARSGRAASAPMPIWPGVEWLAADPLVTIPDPAVTRAAVANHDRVWLVVSHESRSLDDLATIVTALRAGHIEREAIRLHRVELRLWVRSNTGHARRLASRTSTAGTAARRTGPTPTPPSCRPYGYDD